MMPFKKEFNSCPNCASTDRFFESISKELRDAGLARPDWFQCYDIKQGVVVDPVMEKSKPIGAKAPAYRIFTDICSQCGTIYVIYMEFGEAEKHAVKEPPRLVLPGMSKIPINDPRYS